MLQSACWLCLCAVLYVKTVHGNSASIAEVAGHVHGENCREAGSLLHSRVADDDTELTRTGKPDEDKSERSNAGTLSPDCVSSYYQMFVTRRVPPRNYQYFHEVDLAAQETSGAVPLSWRIVGGKEVSITSVPYQVLYGLYCGGALIAPNWVITAAHCRTKAKYVYAGSAQRSQATRYKVCAHFIHPRWEDERNSHPQDYDYQLILLEKPVPVTPSSRPIAIGDENDIKTGAVVAVSGWGYTKFKERHMQENLRRVFVPVMSYDVCSKLPNRNYQIITPRMFCAGYLNGTKDSCQGDSGGPVVLNGKLVGLVSFGVGCAAPDQPGAYANVPRVRDWIRAITTLPL